MLGREACVERNARYKRLELASLRSFCLAAEQGSFSEAAKRQGLSTPAVWKQVRALERILGASLLLRKGKTVQQTEEGRLLWELAKPHVTGLDSLITYFEARRLEVASQITVASTPSVLAYRLPLSVKEFTERHPAVRLHLKAGTSNEIVRMVKEGEADLGIIGYFSEEPLGRVLAFEHLYYTHLALITPAGHPLARKKKITAADIVQYPVMTYPIGDRDRQALERILGQYNLADRLNTVIETRSVDIARRLVGMDVGIAILYVTLEMAAEMPELHIRALDPKREFVSMGLLTRKSVHLSPVVQAFCQLLRDRLGQPRASKQD
ncbi:LysR family transcriptional regulator [Singulisphaera sp. PoT]|uniref:LysR family transcriptional regulator n=1 Tax=Singulisphaera sp. PoT TaxID=3411797 RepID=UPI003BF59AFF